MKKYFNVQNENNAYINIENTFPTNVCPAISKTVPSNFLIVIIFITICYKRAHMIINNCRYASNFALEIPIRLGGKCMNFNKYQVSKDDVEFVHE